MIAHDTLIHTLRGSIPVHKLAALGERVRCLSWCKDRIGVAELSVDPVPYQVFAHRVVFDNGAAMIVTNKTRFLTRLGDEVGFEVLRRLHGAASRRSLVSDPIGPFEKFDFKMINVQEPSAVDRLGALEAPDGEGGQRCRDYDVQQERFKEDQAEIDKIMASPARHEFLIDVSDPAKHSCKAIKIDREDGRTTFAFRVDL